MRTIELGRGREIPVDLQSIAKALAIALPIVGFVGVVGPYVLGFHSLATLALYVAVPSLLAPVLYQYASDPETALVSRARTGDTLLVSAYVVLQAVSVLVLATSAVRPYSYYAVIATLAVLILAQILRFSPSARRVWSILGQISLLHLNLVWGVTLKYNYFIGRPDVFGHVQAVQLILENDGIPAEFAGFYEAFPLWHVLGSMEHIVFGGHVAPRTTLFVLSGVLYAVIPVVVYLVARRLFDSYRVALTAGLVASLNATVIHNGMYAIPRSVAGFLFVFVLLMWVRDDGRSIFLFGLFSLAIAAYHTVSLPFVFAILSIDYFFRRAVVPALSGDVVPRQHGATYFLLALIVVVQAVYWLFFAEYLLEHVVSVAFQQSSPGQVNTGVVQEPVRELANYVHNSAILVFIFVGSLTGLSSDRLSGPAKAALLSSLVLLGLSFPGPHLLVGRLAESFNVLRFAQYAYPFIAMAAAYGVIALLHSANTSRITVDTIKVIALVVFVVFSVATISNDFVASDNPAVERQFYTNYITEAEERSFRTAGAITAGNVSSDYVSTRYLEASRYEDRAHILGVSENLDRIYFGSEDDIVLIRERELERRPLQVWATDEYRYGVGYLGELRYVDEERGLWSDLVVANRMYDSGVAAGYQSSLATRATPTTESTVRRTGPSGSGTPARTPPAGVVTREERSGVSSRAGPV